MTTPTISTMVTQGPNTTTPIVARIRALHERLLKAEIPASVGKAHQSIKLLTCLIITWWKEAKALIS
jgi:hypothetical protein